MENESRLTAYNSSTKEKNVPIYDAKINKISSRSSKRVSYMIKGKSQDGKYNLSAVTSAAKAEEAINAGVASRGEGWD